MSKVHISEAAALALTDYLGRGPRCLPAILDHLHATCRLEDRDARLLLERLKDAGFVRRLETRPIYRGRVFQGEYALTVRYAVQPLGRAS